jgi:hypothetical protein
LPFFVQKAKDNQEQAFGANLVCPSCIIKDLCKKEVEGAKKHLLNNFSNTWEWDRKFYLKGKNNVGNAKV